MTAEAASTFEVPSWNALTPSFKFPSKAAQRMLINAASVSDDAKEGLILARNPIPLLMDGMNGFSLPNLVPPADTKTFIVNKKPVLPTEGPVYMLPSLGDTWKAAADRDQQETETMQVASANAQLTNNNLRGAELLLGRPLTFEEIINRTITPETRLDARGQPQVVNMSGTRFSVGAPAGAKNGASTQTELSAMADAAVGDDRVVPYFPPPPPRGRAGGYFPGLLPPAPTDPSERSRAEDELRRIVEVRDRGVQADPVVDDAGSQASPETEDSGSQASAEMKDEHTIPPAYEFIGAGPPTERRAPPNLSARERRAWRLQERNAWREAYRNWYEAYGRHAGRERPPAGHFGGMGSGIGGGIAGELHDEIAREDVDGAPGLDQPWQADSTMSALGRRRAEIRDAISMPLTGRSTVELAKPLIERTLGQETALRDAEDDVNAGVDEDPRMRMSGGRIGGFLLDDKKLLGKNVVSLRYPTGKKIYDFPNVEVGDNLREALLRVSRGLKPDHKKLTGGEVDYLSRLMKRSAHSKKRDRISAVGRIPQLAGTELQILLGEVKAGNNSPLIATKLKLILRRLPQNYPLNRNEMLIIRQALSRGRGRQTK